MATLAPLAWTWAGLREGLAMLWMTFWPLVLGFSLSGLVQAAASRDGLRARLGGRGPRAIATASVLGTISSSCSYAASAMARALFSRGASWTSSLAFMVASTNLVVELGVVLYLFLGWQFVVAQVVGGLIMVALLSLFVRVVFPASGESALRLRVDEALGALAPASGSTTTRLREFATYRRAARYAIGDVTMLRRELLIGFVVAGFLSVHVPNSWWSHLFISGHGAWTSVADAIIAPAVAVLSFVCSVGNIPLAAALWLHGVAFGGVIAFIFADLITLPLLLVYRRLYGTAVAVRLLVTLWATMSIGGIAVDGLFHLAHLVPSDRHPAALQGHFEMGWTLGLNIVAAAVLVTAAVIARRGDDVGTAIDPICAMTVDVSAPAATRMRNGETFYFCSPRCAERFDRGAGEALSGAAHEEAIDPICAMTVDVSAPAATRMRNGETFYFCCEGCAERFDALGGVEEMHEVPGGDAIDPICGMTVDSATAISATGPDGTTHYFCSEGCRRTFIDGPQPQAIFLRPGPHRG